MINCRARSYGLMLLGEANRQAPAQAELRPTCAEASCVNPSGRRTGAKQIQIPRISGTGQLPPDGSFASIQILVSQILDPIAGLCRFAGGPAHQFGGQISAAVLMDVFAQPAQ